jgi:putative NADH-flavin reductase
MSHTTMARRLVLLGMAAALAGAALPAGAGLAPLQIIVYGGTGNIGQRIVNEALSRGHTVTVVSRSPKPAGAANPRLRFVQGDVLDTPAVTAQIAGQDVAISVVRAPRGPGADPDFYANAARSIVSAQRQLQGAARGKAPRLIVCGGASNLLDADGRPLRDSAEFSRVPRAEVTGHKAELDYLRALADVEWTYFSPAGSIVGGTRTGRFRLGDEHIVRDAAGRSRISTEDLAVALLDEVEQPRHLRRQFTAGY